ncbi:MAG: hypothetical protein JO015_00345 [Verrucomicrobia bacterium]|nr:hypothetical protein [Verrucomicrobiota bacterium]
MSSDLPLNEAEIERLNSEQSRLENVLLQRGLDLRDARAEIARLKGLIREMLPVVQDYAGERLNPTLHDADLIARARRAVEGDQPPP